MVGNILCFYGYYYAFNSIYKPNWRVLMEFDWDKDIDTHFNDAYGAKDLQTLKDVIYEFDLRCIRPGFIFGLHTKNLECSIGNLFPMELYSKRIRFGPHTFDPIRITFEKSGTLTHFIPSKK
jgi:hypothetical protein